MEPGTPSQVDTQSQRRVKYGLNVAVAVAAAVALAILINWISYRNFRAGATRWDLTSTRQYSLSPLTRKVLERFNGEFRIVTLLDASEGLREDTQRARDLTEEYARASGKVKVEHINPATELAKREAFEKSIHQRFAKQFEPLELLNTKALAALEHAHRELLRQRTLLEEVLKDKSLAENDPRRAGLFQTQGFLQGQADALSKAIKTIGAYKAVNLPNYSTAYMASKETLEALDGQFYPQILKTRINPLIEDSRTPDLVKDGLLALSEAITGTMASRKPLMVELATAKSVPQYDALLSKLTQPNPLVVIGPDEVIAVNLGELFRSPSQSPDPENRPKEQEQLEEKQFLGEERLTGVLARMTIAQLNPPPMVVFVVTGQGQGGRDKREYTQMLDRLRSMNLQVEVWEPVRRSAFVDPNAKPMPAPQPKPGQRAVWVMLPGSPPDPQDPNSEKNLDTTIKLLRHRLDQGDGLLAIAPPEVMPDALETTILGEWGIQVDSHMAILREVVDRYGQTVPSNEHLVRQWPTELSVSKAIGEAGMSAVFSWASPIVTTNRKPAQAKHYTIALLSGRNLWANLNTGDEARAGKKIQLDAAGDVKKDSFTVALAAEQPPMKEDSPPRRLVVVTDQFFATDQYGAVNIPDPVTRTVRQITPYPGNHELFINSVYWLAGIDELIAASARTQDIRRIGAMSPAKLASLQWTMLIGMPLGTFIIGIGVWMTRRR